MFLQPQLSNKVLTELCHRLTVETDSGIDIRRTWQRETDMARGRTRPYFENVREAINRGDSLSVALAGSGRLFPPLFHEMTDVGERTGTLGRVFRRLESHYRRQVQAQRLFLGTIAWPMFELGSAILIIGALIWVLGIVAQRNNGQPIDILGFGLIGTRGLIIYTNFIVAVGLCIAGVVIAIKRGMLWTRPLQRRVMQLPVIGNALQRIALARLAWALHLTLNVEMDLRRIIPLALRTTATDYYMQYTDQIVNEVAHGEPMHLAFSRTGAFPGDFIDALAVAEESGRIVESMERLSNRYEEEAELAIRTLSTAFGWFIGVCVMGLIVLLIFRLANFYIGTINDALHMTR
ncbi:MAG TPA: type II secretion system F family protein [Lacipirellulaceae bacterium]|jgi:type IV pilus assembly protein PilC|nr:type II secretion system F family protein [Lacipirellulaceae bacterium]